MRPRREGEALLSPVRAIRQASIAACPHLILVASHYREDGTCRCNDGGHREMAEWGYEWDSPNGLWVAPEEETDGA